MKVVPIDAAALSVGQRVWRRDVGERVGHCLDALLAQEYRPLEVIVVDNASQDQSKSILARYTGRIHLIENDSNAGFTAAQNRAIAASHGQWILTLNPDVLVQPGFV